MEKKKIKTLFTVRLWTSSSDINPLVPNTPFIYPENLRKPMFSGRGERVHWEQMN